MKLACLLVVLLASATWLHAADPEGFGLWKGAAIKNDEATLIVGGTMVEPKTVKPHEVRGSSIDGGETKPLGPGDIVHIPANIPHQMKIRSGTKFTYTVIKVDSN